MSDGRAYTYDWSARGQMLVEWTQGVPVRTFTYDGAGRMVEATVFTLTTRFGYDGLGGRVAVEVVGQGTTTYTLDYAGGLRILAEETGMDTTLYLYPSTSLLGGGYDCLGELRDGNWLYYLSDAEGLVRQGVDGQGYVESAWLFDPDGAVLEGPQGPVSHLVCGGVYDWSTGLIYRDGKYFDPTLGIWLALLPLVVVQSGRRKRRGVPWVVVLLVVGVSGVLTACTCQGPSIDQPPACAEVTPLGEPLGDNAVFVGPMTGNQLAGYPEAMTWTADDERVVESTLTDVISNEFGGPRGFRSLGSALAAFGVSPDDPIILVREATCDGVPIVPASTCKPYLFVYDYFFDLIGLWPGKPVGEATLTHEMGHYWDRAQPDSLPGQMQGWINWGDTATERGLHGEDEDLSEALKVYFYGYSDWPIEEGRRWTDDDWAGLALASDPRYGVGGVDGLRLAANYRLFPMHSTSRLSADGIERVKDRYDWLQMKFGLPY